MALNNTQPGDVVEIDFQITNTGVIQGEQDILLTLENGTKTTVDEVSGLSLATSATGTGTLVWEIPDSQTLQIYNLCVESNDTSSCIWDPLDQFDETATTGYTENWSHPNVFSNAVLTVSVSGDYVYAASQLDEVAKFNISDGSVVWSAGVSLDGPRASEYDAGVLYLGGQSGMIAALDASTGSILWTDNTGIDSIVGTVSTSGGRIYLGHRNGSVLALSRDNRSEIWQSDLNSGWVHGSAYDDGILYTGADSGTQYAINASDGTEIWNHSNTSDGVYGLGYGGGGVYYGDDNAVVTGVDSSDGSFLWSVTNGTQRTGGVAYADEAVFAVGFDGNVECYNSSTGSTIWSQSTSETAPNGMEFHRGVLYIAAGDAESALSYGLDGG